MRALLERLRSAIAYCWLWSQAHPYNAIVFGILFVALAFLTRWVTVLLGLVLIAGAIKGMILKILEKQDE